MVKSFFDQLPEYWFSTVTSAKWWQIVVPSWASIAASINSKSSYDSSAIVDGPSNPLGFVDVRSLRCYSIEKIQQQQQ